MESDEEFPQPMEISDEDNYIYDREEMARG